MANQQFVGSNTVFTIEGQGLWRTQEFGVANPAWQSIADDTQPKFLGEVFRDFEIDPFCSAMQGTGSEVGIYLLTDAGLYYCSNATAATISEDDWQETALANYHLIRAARQEQGTILAYSNGLGATGAIGNYDWQIDFDDNDHPFEYYENARWITLGGTAISHYGSFKNNTYGNPAPSLEASYPSDNDVWFYGGIIIDFGLEGATVNSIEADVYGEPSHSDSEYALNVSCITTTGQEFDLGSSGGDDTWTGWQHASKSPYRSNVRYLRLTVNGHRGGQDETLHPRMDNIVVHYYGSPPPSSHTSSVICITNAHLVSPTVGSPRTFGTGNLVSTGMDITDWAGFKAIHAAGQDGRLYEAIGFEGSFSPITPPDNQPINGVRIWQRQLNLEQAGIQNDEPSQLHGLVSCWGGSTSTVKRTQNDYDTTVDFSPQVSGNYFVAAGPNAYETNAHNARYAMFVGYPEGSPTQRKVFKVEINENGTAVYTPRNSLVNPNFDMLTFGPYRSEDVYACGPVPSSIPGSDLKGVAFSSDSGETFTLKNGNLPVGDYLKILPVLEVPADCGGPDNHKRLSCDCGNTGGCNATTSNPIELRSGNKVLAETDLTIQSPSGVLAFTRSYIQDEQATSDFQFMGLGWIHNHIGKVTFTGTSPNRTVEVRLGNGGLLKLTESGANHFEAKAGSAAFMDYNSGTQEYTLTAQDNSTYVFAATTSLLIRRTWPNNEVWTYSYASGNLTQVDDGYGRQLRFAYINNPGQFNHNQLWRVGDHTANLSVPNGRYVEFGYVVEQLNGIPVTPSPRALLATVRDVRGQTWSYDYYGQDTGESNTNQANFMLRRLSPAWDSDGDGAVNAGSEITLEQLTYTLSGSTITAMTQQRGNNLLQTALAFQQGGGTQTTETVDGKATKHHFGQGTGVYLGPENPLQQRSRQMVNRHYRPMVQLDPAGNETVLEWSGNGKNLQRVTDALSNTTQFSYDSSDRLTSSTDAEGRKTEYTYGDATNPRLPTVIKVRDVNGATFLQHQTFSYDSQGRVLTERQINPTDGTTILREVTRSYYAFDDANIGARGMLQTLTQQDMGSANNDVSTTYVYDSYGRVVQTNQNSTFGSCTHSYTVYDGASQVVASICNYENAGAAPTTAAEAVALYNPADPDRNRVTTHTYDQLGRRIQTTVNAGSSEALTTLTVYDALHRVVRTVSNFVAVTAPANPYTAAHSAFSNHGSDNTQNLVTDTAYNARGLVESQTDVLGNTVRYVYDDAGRQVKVIQNYVSNGVDPTLWVWNNNEWQNGSGVAISYGANQDQNIISTSEYDANGNLIQTRDGLGKLSCAVYDALNRVVKTVRNWQPGGTGYTTDPTTWVWDAGQGRWEDAAGQPIPFGASNDQNLVSQTKYDHMGRVVRTQDETGEWTLFGYDSLGRQVRVIRNASSATYNLVADPDLGSYSLSGNADQDILTMTVYDVQGRVDYTIDVNGSQTKFVYDGLGRQVRTVQNWQPAGGGYNTDPTTWTWNGTAWQDGAAVTVPHGVNQDQNVVNVTNYDTDGRVRWTQDVLGRKTWHVYDNVNREIKTIVNCTYNGTGTTPEDPTYTGSPDSDKDVMTQTVYDAFGRVSVSIDARGNETRYFYNKLGRRTRTIANYVAQGGSDPATWVWDSADHRWEQSNGTVIGHGTNNDENLISEPTYDLAGRVLASRDPSGKLMQQIYDQANRRIRSIANYVVQGSSNPAAWLWDDTDKHWEDGSSNTINHGTDFDLNLISDTIYNVAGQVVAARDGRGTPTGFIYDGLGRRQQVVQAEGTPLVSKAYTAYDKGGRVVRSVRNWQSAATTHNSDPLTWIWNATLQRWEDNGNPVKSILHGVLNDQNLPMAYTVDKLGRVLSMTSPVGSITSTVYYKDGRVKSTTDPLGYVTEQRYDALRRLRRVVQAYLSNGVDPADWRWDFGQHRWEYGSNSVIGHNSPANDRNIIADVTLDVAGRQTAILGPRGNQTTYAYDWLNRRTGLTDSLANTWATAYTELSGGQSRVLSTLPSPLNHQTEQNFDRLGRVIGINYLDESPKLTPDVAFSYDLAGNRALMREFDGATTIRRTEYSYDAARRLSQVGYDNDGSGTIDQTVDYEYDRGGLRTQMTLPGDLTITYTYDERGQLLTLTDWDDQVTQYAYDAAGRLVSMERANELRSTYSYDSAGRLKQLRHTRRDKVLGHFAYEVDARGNRTKAIETLPSTTTNPSPLTWNSGNVAYYLGTWTPMAGATNSFMGTTDPTAAMRLMFFGKQVTLTLGVGPDHGICDIYVDNTFWQSIDSYAPADGEDSTIAINLAHEGPHLLEIRNRADKNTANTTVPATYKLRFRQLAFASGSGVYDLHSVEYTYDALARLSSAKYRLGANTMGTVMRGYNYSYDRAGNRTQQFDIVPNAATDYIYDEANHLTFVSPGYHPVTHDVAGRLLNDSTLTYTWDRAGRMLNAGTSSYAYNGLGQRISQTVGANVTQYLLDTQSGLYQVLAATTGAAVDRYVHGPTGIQAQQDSGNNWEWMVPDGLGNVRSVVDNNMGVLHMQHFAPYGTSWGAQGTAQTPFGFTGEPTELNGLLHLRARYYNPALGVFPSLDPLEGSPMQPMSFNRYAYVRGNPTNLVDPSGLIAENPNMYSSCQSDSRDGCANGAIAVLDISTPTSSAEYIGVNVDFRDTVLYRRGNSLMEEFDTFGRMPSSSATDASGISWPVADNGFPVNAENWWYPLPSNLVNGLYSVGKLDSFLSLNRRSGEGVALQIQTNHTGFVKFRRCSDNSKFTIPPNSFAHIDRSGEWIFTLQGQNLSQPASEWSALPFDKLRSGLLAIEQVAITQESTGPARPNTQAANVGIESSSVGIGIVTIGQNTDGTIIGLGGSTTLIAASSTWSIAHAGRSGQGIYLTGFVGLGVVIGGTIGWGEHGFYASLDGGYGFGISGGIVLVSDLKPLAESAASTPELIRVPVQAGYDNYIQALSGGRMHPTIEQRVTDAFVCGILGNCQR